MNVPTKCPSYVPTALPARVSIGAVPRREDARDVLIGPAGASISLQSLLPGGRIGTSLLRRAALLRALRPDLEVVKMRGNLDTRIGKVDRGEVAAVVLAAAGLLPLGWSTRVSEYFELNSWRSAPGQGALAITVRSGDLPTARWLARLGHMETRAAVTAERTLLEVLDTGCQLLVAALGIPFGGGLRLKGLVAHPDGRRAVRAEGTGAQDGAVGLGRRIGESSSVVGRTSSWHRSGSRRRAGGQTAEPSLDGGGGATGASRPGRRRASDDIDRTGRGPVLRGLVPHIPWRYESPLRGFGGRGCPAVVGREAAGAGWVTAEYGMLPRATHTRRQRERGGAGGRTREIERLIGRSLRAVTDLELPGPRTVVVDCDVIREDGGTRTTSITGGCVALALWTLEDQGVVERSPELDVVAAVSVGLVDSRPRLDLNYEGDRRAQVDLNVATEHGEFGEVQGTAEGEPFDRAALDGMLAMALGGIVAPVARQRTFLEGGQGVKLLLATRSGHKLQEIRTILRNERRLELVDLNATRVPVSRDEELIEEFDTFEKN